MLVYKNGYSSPLAQGRGDLVGHVLTRKSPDVDVVASLCKWYAKSVHAIGLHWARADGKLYGGGKQRLPNPAARTPREGSPPRRKGLAGLALSIGRAVAALAVPAMGGGSAAAGDGGPTNGVSGRTTRAAVDGPLTARCCRQRRTVLRPIPLMRTSSSTVRNG